MSRSNMAPSHPCKKFIEFKGDKGQFFYYDKEQKKQIELLVPLYLVVLDELSTITGFNKEFDCNIYSNEVHYLDKEIMTVKTRKGGRSVVGKYDDIKDTVKAMGGKYTKSIYCMLVNSDKTTELVNIKLHGGAVSEWIGKKINANDFVIGITDFVQKQNGGIKYMVPVFTPYKLSEAVNEQAIAMDRVLQQYLQDYKNRQVEAAEAEPYNPLTEEQVHEPASAPAESVDFDDPQAMADEQAKGWEQLYDVAAQNESNEETSDGSGVEPLPF